MLRTVHTRHPLHPDITEIQRKLAEVTEDQGRLDEGLAILERHSGVGLLETDSQVLKCRAIMHSSTQMQTESIRELWIVGLNHFLLNCFIMYSAGTVTLTTNCAKVVHTISRQLRTYSFVLLCAFIFAHTANNLHSHPLSFRMCTATRTSHHSTYNHTSACFALVISPSACPLRPARTHSIPYRTSILPIHKNRMVIAKQYWAMRYVSHFRQLV